MAEFEENKKRLLEYRQSFFDSFKKCEDFSVLEEKKRLIDEQVCKLKGCSRVYKILDRDSLVFRNEKPECFSLPFLNFDEFGNRIGES